MFNFEKFEAYGGSFSPKISLRNNGQIGISQGALRKLGISDEGQHVVLYYDSGARVIGIKPVSKDADPAAIPVHVRPTSKDGSGSSLTAHISGRSFLECYGIRYRDKTRTYVPEWNDEHEMFIVDLKREHGSRKPRKRELDDDLDEDGGAEVDAESETDTTDTEEGDGDAAKMPD